MTSGASWRRWVLPSGAEWRTLAVSASVITLWMASPLLHRGRPAGFAPPVEAVALAGGLALFLPGMRC